MRISAKILLIYFLAALVNSAHAQEPQLLSSPGVSPAVWGVLEKPSSPGAHPGVVILPGSYGWRPAYALIARALADSGFAALALDYMHETGRDSLPQQRREMRPRWLAAIRGAVRFLAGQAYVERGRIGLVGYSRGAFLAVAAASSLPEVRAVVDYFGGIDTTAQSTEEQLRGFPPLLILHGDSDRVVPVERAYQLRKGVIDRGGEVEMHIYPGADHAFNGAFSPNYRREAAEDSFRRTVEFLRRRLEGE